MGVQSVLYINDFDTSAIGLVVAGVPDIGNIPATAPVTRALYQRAGLVQVATSPKLAERTITVRGTIVATTVVQRDQYLDALKALCLSNLVEVRFLQPTDRFWRAYLTRLVTTPFSGPQFLAAAVQVELTFTAYDPIGYSLSVRASAFGAAPLAAPAGTAPSAPLLRLSGGTDPVVTLRDAAGVARQTIGFTITLAAGDYLDVDCQTMTITKSVSGTVTDALSTLASGDFLVLDPAYGALTLEVNSGTGVAFYRKAWL